MIASLPMYDRPETRAAHDRFYSAIRTAYASDMPAELTRTGDLWDHWTDPNLILSQTCSLPFRTRLHDKVHIIASPIHAMDCPPGTYFSVVVKRKNSELGSTPKIAINEERSQSGWMAIYDWATTNDVPIGTPLVTGAHWASAQVVATGQADLAAIDAVTWSMMKRFDDFTDTLQEIGNTEPTPSLPYITANPDLVEPLYQALEQAVAALSAEDRELLNLGGIAQIPASSYLNMENPPVLAA